MRHLPILLLVIALAVSGACRKADTSDAAPAAADASRGTIKGRVRLMSAPPPNPEIRMRTDPMCATANAGQRVAQEMVVSDGEGHLANVFVQLQGSFPATAVPREAVSIDQRGCVYLPRMVGVRIGQTLRVGNSDPGLHNVHGLLVAGGDQFNVGQPVAGMVNEFHLQKEGILRLQCDVHGWMVAYVGVTSHPYFAVTGKPGTFEMPNVPAGSYTIQAWHEVYGPLTSTVEVTPGGVADVDFVYSGQEKR